MCYFRSTDRASTPSSGKGKGKSGGKTSQKRKSSPPHMANENAPVSALAVTSPSAQSRVVCESPDATSSLLYDVSGVKRSERTRNRKVDYAAMNSGLHADDNPDSLSSHDLSEENIMDCLAYQIENESEVLIGSNYKDQHINIIQNNTEQKVIKMGSSLLKKVVLIKNSPVLKPNGFSNVTIATAEGETSLENHYNFQEEIEIRRLRSKQKRRGLNNTEKKKLKRLRERLRLKVKNLKRKIDTLKKNNGLATSPKKILIKSMKTVQAKQRAILQHGVPSVSITSLLSQTPLISVLKIEADRVNVPEIMNKTVLVKTEPKAKEVIVVQEQTSLIKEEVKSEVIKAEIKSETRPVVKAEVDKDNTVCVRDTSISTNVTPEMKPKKLEMRLRSPANKKIIFPVLHRSNPRGRLQVGNLHLYLYKAKDSSCIQCTTCSDFLNVREFLKHLHHQNIADELCTVTLPQKLEMAVVEPSDEQTRWWGDFERKRNSLETSPANKSSQRTSRRASSEKEKKEATSPSLMNPIINSKKTTANVNNNLVSEISSQGQRVTAATSAASSPTITECAAGFNTPLSAGTRQSTRVRKRKQLHPIESYVYSSVKVSSHASGGGDTTPQPTKRLKLATEPALPTTPVTPLVKRGVGGTAAEQDVVTPGSKSLPDAAMTAGTPASLMVMGSTTTDINAGVDSSSNSACVHENVPENVQIVGDNTVMVG